MASTSDKLDLSDCELDAIPEGVFELVNLKDLSLAGNKIPCIPAEIGHLTALERLVIAGNELDSLPCELTQLPSLKGLWAHGNRLRALPEDWAPLTQLETLSLAGNALESVPESLGGLAGLDELNLAGNRISSLPDSFGGLQKLRKLFLHGNLLTTIPAALARLPLLTELKAMGNEISHLPDDLFASTSLVKLNLADNALTELPDDWRAMTALQVVWLYGNALTRLPASLAQLPLLQHAWLEGNALSPDGAAAFMAALSDGCSLRRIGLDVTQIPPALLETHDGVPGVCASGCGAAPRVRVGMIRGTGAKGYFKLQPGPGFGDAAVSFSDGSQGQRCLVVAFGSAPGDPNWGGLISRIRAVCKQPEHQHFDTLFVVDTTRSWYNGGDEGFQYWHDRLEKATQGYSKVLMLGDSMGATAALLFSPLATAVAAFTPQIDLTNSAIRPSASAEWCIELKRKLLANVSASSANIQVHSGTWANDLEQCNQLRDTSAAVNVHYLDSHRLAAFLNSEDKLLPIVHTLLAFEMGYDSGYPPVTPRKKVRVSNLL